jgi:hypothetical protein
MPVIPTPNIRTFQVFPRVPEPLTPLLEMAHNLWWVWHPDAAEMFRRLDRKLWEEVYHNPVKLLGVIDQSKLAAAAADARREGDNAFNALRVQLACAETRLEVMREVGCMELVRAQHGLPAQFGGSTAAPTPTANTVRTGAATATAGSSSQ